MTKQMMCRDCILSRGGRFISLAATVTKDICPACGKEELCYPRSDYKIHERAAKRDLSRMKDNRGVDFEALKRRPSMTYPCNIMSGTVTRAYDQGWNECIASLAAQGLLRTTPEDTKGDGWQPIETAPRDKIIFVGNERTQDFYCRFHKGHWCYWGLDDFDRMEWVRLEYKPTHWMPLPAPPAISDALGKV